MSGEKKFRLKSELEQPQEFPPRTHESAPPPPRYRGPGLGTRIFSMVERLVRSIWLLVLAVILGSTAWWLFSNPQVFKEVKSRVTDAKEWSQGVREITCPKCKGQKQLTCETCEGSGYERVTRQEACKACGGDGQIYMRLSRKNVPCPGCKGKGTIPKTTTSVCSACGGKGFAACSMCNGAGVIKTEGEK